jgi:oligoendopeptidase F
VRRRAFKQFYAEFNAHKFTVASTLANSVKADVFHARARNSDPSRVQPLDPAALRLRCTVHFSVRRR